MGNLFQVDEVVFGEDDLYLLSYPGQFTGKSEEDFAEASHFGERGEFSSKLYDLHKFPYKGDKDFLKRSLFLCCSNRCKIFSAGIT